MKTLISATVVCSLLFAVCMAFPMSDSEATAQGHLTVPAFGCSEVAHQVGGQYFRIYLCDHNLGTCVFTNNVQRCSFSTILNTNPSLSSVVNVRDRDHLIRFYNAGFGDYACYFTLVQNCECSTEQEVEVEDQNMCRSFKLPSGEILHDPIGCVPKSMEDAQIEEECKSIKLPTGETFYDPLDCGIKTKDEPKKISQTDMMNVLLNLLAEN